MLLSFSLRVQLLWFVVATTSALAQESTDGGIAPRSDWKSSRVKGSPEKPNPLKVVPAFPKLKFDEPMHVRWSSSLQRYIVCELRGKLWSFCADENVSQADLMVDLKSDLKSFDPQRSTGVQEVYSIALDPNFESNRFIYVCMVLGSKLGKPLEDGTRVSRFRITDGSSPRLDLSSELPIIEWLAGGHNGCDLAFDNSGHLLISTGDSTEPSPPDRLKTGQDISDLLASILRIDVREATPEQPYRIPDDNPFQHVPNARKEVWAFGFRNPWRISIDRVSGALFVGDVGWEKWEMIHRVERGSNHGWSVREGRELIQADASLGPAEVVPPWIELSHAEAASITGGFVYRGQQFPEFVGHYFFGDWVHGRIWGVPLDGTQSEHEVASTSLRIIAFEPDADGESLVVNHLSGTTLFRLVPNDQYERELTESQRFPRKLSATGLFENVKQQTPKEGVLRFSINQPMWQDGATATHYLGLPSDSTVTVYDSPQPLAHMAMFASRLHYPAGTVLAKTLSWKGRCIETQLLYFDGVRWQGYSYLWNAEQNDAELVPREGKEIVLGTPGKKRWRIHSRSECFQCHNPWPETTLAFTPEQLHQPEFGEQSVWLQLQRRGYVKTVNSNREPVPAERCVRVALPRETNTSVEHRARSYLHVNCAHCHQFGAGTGVAIDLRRPNSEAELKMISVKPEKGEFGFKDSQLIDPGESSNSILTYRIASSSVGHMPHIGSREVDFAGVALVADWIDGLGSGAEVNSATASQLSSELAHALLLSNSSSNTSNSVETKPGEERRRLALQLAIQLAKHANSASSEGNELLSKELLQQLAKDSDTVISSLFEAFIPSGERIQRMSSGSRWSDIANLDGDVLRGSQLFRDPNRLQCSRCHELAHSGGQIGPKLDAIGLKLAKSQLFEAIAEPSRLVEAKYQTQRVRTDDGAVVTGLIESESEHELSLVAANGEKIRIPIKEIAERKSEPQSLMPTGLMEQMTAQEMADLIEYLSSLR
jgi:putative heme-binding domain-containing protein